MQTFLPFPDFKQSAKCLDMKRLGKQRVECYQILKCLCENFKPWSNHPAVLMWKGYENELALYGISMCKEWINRGYQDNMSNRINGYYGFNPTTLVPQWLGNEKFHSCMRATLLFKNFEWYKQFNWMEKPRYEYWWPTKQNIAN